MSKYEADITPLIRRFWIATALLLIAAIVCVALTRTRRLMEKTHDGLLKARAGLGRVREAGESREKALATLKTLYMQSSAGTSPERLIYAKIDELNTRLRPDDMTISAIEKKGGEVSLQYTFKFINPNYNELLNNVSYLGGNIFPLTTVSTVTIAQAEAGGKSVLNCTVTGKVLTSEKNGP
jgi:hypothetical protein